MDEKTQEEIDELNAAEEDSDSEDVDDSEWVLDDDEEIEKEAAEKEAADDSSEEKVKDTIEDDPTISLELKEEIKAWDELLAPYLDVVKGQQRVGILFLIGLFLVLLVSFSALGILILIVLCVACYMLYRNGHARIKEYNVELRKEHVEVLRPQLCDWLYPDYRYVYEDFETVDKKLMGWRFTKIHDILNYFGTLQYPLPGGEIGEVYEIAFTIKPSLRENEGLLFRFPCEEPDAVADKLNEVDNAKKKSMVMDRAWPENGEVFLFITDGSIDQYMDVVPAMRTPRAVKRSLGMMRTFNRWCDHRHINKEDVKKNAEKLINEVTEIQNALLTVMFPAELNQSDEDDENQIEDQDEEQTEAQTEE